MQSPLTREFHVLGASTKKALFLVTPHLILAGGALLEEPLMKSLEVG